MAYDGPAEPYNPCYPDTETYIHKTGEQFIWEADQWQETCRSWAESCYIHTGISGVAFVFEGPDAQQLLNDTAINDCMQWPVGKCKHIVQCDEEGLIINHGLYTRDSETRFRCFACAPNPVFMQMERKQYDVKVEMEPTFVFQISGPMSLPVIEKALQANYHDVAFLETRPITVPGIEGEFELCRIGMSGTLAYEIRGPKELAPQVYDLVYETGKPYGMKRLGWRCYPVNHTYGGYPQMTVSFEFALFKDPEFRKTALTPFVPCGSVDPEDIRARFRTPAEVDWMWMAKFNHDFVGREAVEAEAAAPKRKAVSLVLNADDVVDVYRSLFEDGEPYKYMEMPCSETRFQGGHADYVVDGEGKVVGISSMPVYSSYYKVSLCHCMMDIDEAEEGREVIIKWGDYGKRIKDIRATVAKFPYNQLVENNKYDLSTVPCGVDMD